MVEIHHYSPGLRAKRCWTDVDDFCPRKPVVQVVTELFARHYCSTCFARWKKGVREMALVLGDGTGSPTMERVAAAVGDGLRRRVADELAAIVEDEQKRRVSP